MATNPSPAAREAALAIIADRTPLSLMVSREHHLSRIIDRALAPERKAAEEIIETISFHAIEPDGCYSRINTTELEQAIANYRRTRGGE